jgi:hypothetical protein
VTPGHAAPRCAVSSQQQEQALPVDEICYLNGHIQKIFLFFMAIAK